MENSLCAEFGIRAESVRSGVRSPAQHDETWLDFIVTFVIVVVVLFFLPHLLAVLHHFNQKQ